MDVELLVATRKKGNKGSVGALRREDRVPGILYGPKTAPVPLSLSAKRLEKLLKDMGEESKLLRLTFEDGDGPKTRQVLIREVQIHPVRRRFLHVDFYEVPMDQAIVVDIPVELLGEPVGVKMKGGMLNLIRRTISVRCLPGEIPEKVQIDVAGLDVGDTIHVGDLMDKVSFELADDPSFAVANVSSAEGKEEAAGSEAEGTAAE
jgi:large subunit ribosomal protein L25